MLVKPHSAVPRVDVTVDLLSARQRPYLFRAVAVGLPPHAFRRAYEIRAVSDDAAAMRAIELFCEEFGPPVLAGAAVTPGAVRQ